MITPFSLRLLSISHLCFALLAALVSTLFFALLIRGASNLQELALPGVLAVTLSSILFWWLLIVHPRRVTLLRGMLAGVFSTVLTPFLTFVIWGIAFGQLFQGSLAALFLGIIAMVAVSVSPLGWILIAIGGCIGALLAFFTRRWALNSSAGEGNL